MGPFGLVAWAQTSKKFRRLLNDQVLVEKTIAPYREKNIGLPENLNGLGNDPFHWVRVVYQRDCVSWSKARGGEFEGFSLAQLGAIKINEEVFFLEGMDSYSREIIIKALAPLTPDQIERLVEQFGTNMHIGKEILKWNRLDRVLQKWAEEEGAEDAAGPSTRAADDEAGP